MKLANRKPLLAIAALLATSLAAFSGCSLEIDPPANGVQIKIEKPISDDVEEDFKEKLKALAGSTSTSTITINGKMTMNLSPVADIKAFADKIDFAKVVKIEGNVIWLEELKDPDAGRDQDGDDDEDLKDGDGDSTSKD